MARLPPRRAPHPNPARVCCSADGRCVMHAAYELLIATFAWVIWLPVLPEKTVVFFLLFLFFARHNLLRYNSSWHVEDITNAKKTNIQNQCCCFFSPPNIEISIWTYTARTEDKEEVLFFFTSTSAVVVLISLDPSRKANAVWQRAGLSAGWRHCVCLQVCVAVPHMCCMDGFVRGRLLIG